MRKEKEIQEMIDKIESGDTVNTDDNGYTGLTEITTKGNDWIEALKWALENDI